MGSTQFGYLQSGKSPHDLFWIFDGQALGFSTAQLNPVAKSFCLEPPEHAVLIPIVFNNTHPTYISYSLSTLGDDNSRVYVNLSSRDLKQIEKVRSDTLTALQQTDPDERDDTDDDYYDYNEPSRQRVLSRGTASDSEYRLGKTEVLQHIKVSRPGVVRLERALDQANTEVRVRPTEVTVVHCPKVEFVAGGIKDDGKRCTGATEVLDLKLYGVAPLTLKWHRDVAGRQEHFLVEGIEGSHAVRCVVIGLREAALMSFFRHEDVQTRRNFTFL